MSVQTIAQQLAGFEEWHMLFFNLDGVTGPGITPQTCVALFHRERTKTTKLNAITLSHGFDDFFEDRVYNALHVPLVQMGVLICDFLNELRAYHVVCPPKVTPGEVLSIEPVLLQHFRHY